MVDFIFDLSKVIFIISLNTVVVVFCYNVCSSLLADVDDKRRNNK